MINETIYSVDIGHMSVEDGDVAILHALRDILDARDDWTLTDEGTWEEYAESGGVHYAPDIDSYESPDVFADSQEATQDYIRELEDRLETKHDLLGYPDGDSGMYFIERVDA